MKILFLALGDRRTASSRIRAWNFASAVADAGHESTTVEGTDRRQLARALAQRWDIVVVQKWTPPMMLARTIRARSKVMIYDCDDAIYLASEVGARESPYARRNFKRLMTMIDLFDGVSVSTPLMSADFEEMVPDKPRIVFPGPMPVLRPLGDPSERRGLVWLGSPATEGYLARSETILREVQSQYGFLAVGATDRTSSKGLNVAQWSESVEQEVLGRARAGLFLQPEGPWEARKSGYKILEYVASGVLPVVEAMPAVRELLPSDYPYMFEDDPRSAIEAALGLPEPEYAATVQRLIVDSVAKFSFGATAMRWLEFAEGIRR